MFDAPDFLPDCPEDLPRGETCPPGLVIVDKPQGLSSNAVASRIRRLAGQKKVGYAGTLDPLATGILICAIGKATRLLQYLTAHDKVYTARVRFGVSTDTDDALGQVTACLGAVLTPEDIAAALVPWRGPVNQIPAKFSAIKIGGKRAYDLARAGKNVEIQPRPVTIHRLELRGAPVIETVAGDDSNPPVSVTDAELLVECSAGTYVRALARDLGADLGVGAHLTALRRISVGSYGLDQARSLSGLGAEVESRGMLRPLGLDAAILGIFPELSGDETQVRALSFGQAPQLAGSTREATALLQTANSNPTASAGSLLAVTEATTDSDAGEKRVIALAQLENERLKPIWVLRPAKSGTSGTYT